MRRLPTRPNRAQRVRWCDQSRQFDFWGATLQRRCQPWHSKSFVGPFLCRELAESDPWLSTRQIAWLCPAFLCQIGEPFRLRAIFGLHGQSKPPKTHVYCLDFWLIQLQQFWSLKHCVSCIFGDYFRPSIVNFRHQWPPLLLDDSFSTSQMSCRCQSQTRSHWIDSRQNRSWRSNCHVACYAVDLCWVGDLLLHWPAVQMYHFGRSTSYLTD